MFAGWNQKGRVNKGCGHPLRRPTKPSTEPAPKTSPTPRYVSKSSQNSAPNHQVLVKASTLHSVIDGLPTPQPGRHYQVPCISPDKSVTTPAWPPGLPVSRPGPHPWRGWRRVQRDWWLESARQKQAKTLSTTLWLSLSRKCAIPSVQPSPTVGSSGWSRGPDTIFSFIQRD